MNKDEFFAKITENHNNEKDKILELLRVRGFQIIRTVKHECFLDKASIDADLDYLRQLLTEYELGEVSDDGMIHISDSATLDSAKKIFKAEPIPKDMIYMTHMNSWLPFFDEEREKEIVGVSKLEPFVARYIRAINACGIFTLSSCDGNHGRSRKMVIGAYGKPSSLWHQTICMAFHNRNLRWGHNCSELYFTEDTRYDAYYELNKFAEFLSRCSDVLLGIKWEVKKELDEKYSVNNEDAYNKYFIALALKHLRQTWTNDGEINQTRRIKILLYGEEIEIPLGYLAKYKADARWLMKKAEQAGMGEDEIKYFEVNVLDDNNGIRQ